MSCTNYNLLLLSYCESMEYHCNPTKCQTEKGFRQPIQIGQLIISNNTYTEQSKQNWIISH